MMRVDESRARHDQRARRRQIDGARRSSTPPSCCGSCPNCSRCCRRWAIRTSPTLVFFFDEAHLLFDDAAPALLDKVEQVVRLIRSKGVGVYFVTQNPVDVPDGVAGQLGNRVQHKLNAFTPREQKAVHRRRPDVSRRARPRRRYRHHRTEGGRGAWCRCSRRTARPRRWRAR